MDGSYASKLGNLVKDNATDIICEDMDILWDVLPPFTNQAFRVRPTVHLVFPQDMLPDLYPAYRVWETLQSRMQ